MNASIKVIGARVPADLARAAKIEAAKREVSVQELVRTAVEREIARTRTQESK